MLGAIANMIGQIIGLGIAGLNSCYNLVLVMSLVKK
jgi:hypothetical protein